ncbi:Uncharacterized conserved protein UCP014543 [Senna tora]|uniref:Uncharacterized conserved protein UCP014543 n=1 Tax=Senna tora TaxID=362788 RepID=A0A834TDY1_9FABA|nr:Uncharacterized conserved protein UCP014543 [Senna tora]
MLSAIAVSFPPIYHLPSPSPSLILPSISSSSSSSSLHSEFSSSSSSSFNCVSRSKLYRIHRASSEGHFYFPCNFNFRVPNELIEDSKFVPLNTDDPTYGPPALLLLGFETDEALKIQQLLKELDGDFLKVIFCTEDMVTRSLWEAVHKTQPNLEEIKIDKSLPRICFLSGLSGEEMMMFIDAFPETGLKPAVFAALVPNSADKPLEELIEEIMGDHEMLTGEQT